MRGRKAQFTCGFAGVVVLVLAVTVAAFYLYRNRQTVDRTGRLWEWLRNSAAHPEWALQAGSRCGDAPFIFPTDGYIGFLWDDSFRPGHRHQGIDVFGGGEVNVTPVVAAYAGYLTRLPDWRSSVIVRIPEDPFQPGRQIWTYYTHLADAQGNSFIVDDFPPGTAEVYIEAGTLLGYQGNYSGDPGNPVGVHLHFSIVRDDPAAAGQTVSFLNELDIRNTLDPSPYLGLELNGQENTGEVPVCKLNQTANRWGNRENEKAR